MTVPFLRPFEGITINPDEGVVNNYLKFQGVLASERKGQTYEGELLVKRASVSPCSYLTRQRKDVKFLYN